MPKTTFIEAAFDILKRRKWPLHVNEITQLALDKGIIEPSGKTPTATMGAQLYRDIKKLGDKSLFVQIGKNRFGLRE